MKTMKKWPPTEGEKWWNLASLVFLAGFSWAIYGVDGVMPAVFCWVVVLQLDSIIRKL